MGHEHLLPRGVQGEVGQKYRVVMIKLIMLQVLIFLDTFFASGYGLLFLAVFALDCTFILLPLSQVVRRVVEAFKGEGRDLPAWRLFGKETSDINNTKM